MAQTAIQMLDEYIEQMIKNTMEHRDYSVETKLAMKKGLKLAQSEAVSLLQVERKTIEDAYRQGYCDAISSEFEDASDFYEKTFLNNKVK